MVPRGTSWMTGRVVRRALRGVSVPRLPGVPDPLRRIELPADLDSVTTVSSDEDPGGGGLHPGGAERIWHAAVDLYRSGVHPAVQVCVRREGTVVLDRAIGHARGNGPEDAPGVERVAATPETPFLIYSGSKAITALVVHMLHERGALDIDQPVAHYIPEYAANNKADITIGHVLSHRAGVPSLPRTAFDLDRAADPEYILDLLVKARPFARPGRFLAYHAVSGGFILAAVVQRATGREIREVLEDEILAPLGFRWNSYGVRPADVGRVAVNYLTGPPSLPPLSQFMTRALGLGLDELIASSNDPRMLAAVVPSANVVTTANELSRFYEIFRLGGSLDGVRVMRPETVRHALKEQSRLEIDLTLGFPTRFSYGLMLGAQLISLYGPDTQHAFGHLGFTNMLGWADPERGLACAVMTNGKPIVYPEVGRFLLLVQQIALEAPKVDPSSMIVWDPLSPPGRPAARSG